MLRHLRVPSARPPRCELGANPRHAELRLRLVRADVVRLAALSAVLQVLPGGPAAAALPLRLRPSGVQPVRFAALGFLGYVLESVAVSAQLDALRGAAAGRAGEFDSVQQ